MTEEPELGGGGAAEPEGDGDDGVVEPEGDGDGVVEPEGDGDVGVVEERAVTLTANFWPREQWLLKVQMK